MKVGLFISFKKEDRKNNLYKELFEKFVHFLPERIIIKHRTEIWDNEKHKRKIAGYTSDDDLIVGNNDGDIFMSLVTIGKNPYRFVEIIQSNWTPNREDIEAFILNENLISAYLYNEDFEFLQSSTSVESSKRDFAPELLETIKRSPKKINMFGQIEYDTAFNPAKTVRIDGARLMVAWKMWFGKGFEKFVSLDKLANFKNAAEIKLLPQQVVYIKLYDEISKPFTPENIFNQWKWREWVDFDNLSEKFPGVG